MSRTHDAHLGDRSCKGDANVELGELGTFRGVAVVIAAKSRRFAGVTS